MLAGVDAARGPLFDTAHNNNNNNNKKQKQKTKSKTLKQNKTNENKTYLCVRGCHCSILHGAGKDLCVPCFNKTKQNKQNKKTKQKQKQNKTKQNKTKQTKTKQTFVREVTILRYCTASAQGLVRAILFEFF